MSQGLELLLAAQGRLEMLQALKPFQDILVRIRRSQLPDQDGTTCLVLAADLLLTAGLPRAQVDRLIMAVVDRTPEQISQTVLGLLDNSILYGSPVDGHPVVALGPQGPVTGDPRPVISLLITLGVVQEHLDDVLREQPNES